MTTEKQPQKNKWYLDLLNIIPIIALALVIFGLFRSCNERHTPISMPDSILQIQNANLNNKAKYWQNEANKWRAKSGYVKDTIPVLKKRWSSFYDSVIVVADSSCKPFMRRYKHMRDITDSLLMIQINYQDSALIAQDSVINDRTKQIINDTLILAKTNKLLTDTVKYFDKSMRKRYWKGFRHGFGTGVIVTEVGNVVKDIKK